jgi:hypothetical protein
MDMNTLTARTPSVGAPHRMAAWSLALGMALAGALAPAWASNTEIAGVHYQPTLQVEGTALVLNGSGLSYKALQKVYTVGLYLGKKTTSPEEVLTMPGSKQLRFVMLVPMRVDELGKLIARGIETNSSRDEFMRLIPSTIDMGRIFSKMKRMAPGDTIAIEYVPRRGTMFFVNGVPAGMPIAGTEYFNAVLKVWVGPKPTTQDLKEALLDFKPAPLLKALED